MIDWNEVKGVLKDTKNTIENNLDIASRGVKRLLRALLVLVERMLQCGATMRKRSAVT